MRCVWAKPSFCGETMLISAKGKRLANFRVPSATAQGSPCCAAKVQPAIELNRTRFQRARNQQFGFVRIARFFPDHFAMRVSRRLRVFQSSKRAHDEVRLSTREPKRKTVHAGGRIVKQRAFRDRTFLRHRAFTLVSFSRVVALLVPVSCAVAVQQAPCTDCPRAG
jgi:hypothetical protein